MSKLKAPHYWENSFAQRQAKEMGLSLEENNIDGIHFHIQPSQERLSSPNVDDAILHYMDIRTGGVYYFQPDGSRHKKPYQRRRYQFPQPDEKGKTAKYRTEKNANAIPYFNGLLQFHTGGDIPVMGMMEGEKKALVTSKYGLFSIGMQGINTGAVDPIKNDFGDTVAAKFKEDVLYAIEKYSVQKIILLHDADAIDNKGKDDRLASFYASVRNMFMACQAAKIKFAYKVIKKDVGEKGIDDVIQARPAEAGKIRAQFYQLYSGDYFHHFDISGSYDLKRVHLFLKKGKIPTAKIKQPAPDKIIHIQDYLSEAKDQFEDIIARHDRVAIASPTNSGKTTYLNEFSKLYQHRTLFCFPKLMLMDQFCTHNDDVIQIFEKTTKEDRKKATTNKRNASTWHSTWKVADEYQDRDLMVFDEGQLLGSAGGYMNTAIADVYRIIKGTPAKVINISGTHNYQMLKDMGFYIVEVKKENVPKVVIRPHSIDMVGYEDGVKGSGDDVGLACFNYAKKLDYKGDDIHVMLINSKNRQADIKEALITKGILKHDQIAVISAQQRETEDYQNIVREEYIRQGVKLVLMTIVGAEGINILNENIGKIAATDTRCTDTLRQFPNRFRKLKEIKVDLFLPGHYDRDTDNSRKMGVTKDYEELLAEEKALARAHLIYATNFAEDYPRNNPDHFFNTADFNNARDYVFYDKGNQCFDINLPNLHYKVKSRIDRIKTNDQFLEELSQFFTIEEVHKDEIAIEDTGNFKDDRKEHNERRKEEASEFIKMLKEQTGLVLQALIRYVITDKKLIRTIRREFKMQLVHSNEQVDNFFQANQFIKNVKVETVIIRLIELLSVKFFKTDAFALLQAFISSNANWRTFKDTTGYLQRLEAPEDQRNKFMTVLYSSQFKVYELTKEYLLSKYILGEPVKTDAMIQAVRGHLAKVSSSKKYLSDAKIRQLVDKLFVTERTRKGKGNTSYTILLEANSLQAYLNEVLCKVHDLDKIRKADPDQADQLQADIAKRAEQYIKNTQYYNEDVLKKAKVAAVLKNGDSAEISQKTQKMEPKNAAERQELQKNGDSAGVYIYNSPDVSPEENFSFPDMLPMDPLSHFIGQMTTTPPNKKAAS